VTPSLVVVGAGGMGREALDVALASGHRSVGVVADGASSLDLDRLARRGIPFLGSPSDWFTANPGQAYVIGIGAPEARRRLDAQVTALGATPHTIVHPDATVGSDCRLGPGTVVCAGARLSTNVRTGRHAHVGANAAVGHDTVIDDWTSVNPGAVVSGDVSLGHASLVGAGATVLPRLTLGPESTVGAAACVVGDVDRATTVKGVPAR
jgi:sugar O-acyltransferase (sialic acid O-acetyltransferase NeuD family)